MSNDIIYLLQEHIHPVRLKMEHRILADLADAFGKWRAGATRQMGIVPDLVVFLLSEINACREGTLSLRALFSDFNKRWSGAVSEAEKRAHILSFAKAMGASRQELEKDRRAFSRWFGHDAVVDRYQKRTAALERRMALCLDRVGLFAARALATHGPEVGFEKLWRRLGLASAVKPLLAYDGDHRVRIKAFRCLAAALRQMDESTQRNCVEESLLIYVFRSAMDRRQNTWIQCEALALLERMSRDSLTRALTGRLSFRSPSAKESNGAVLPKDDFFVRARAVRILARNVQENTDLLDLLWEAARDPSPHVRQTLAGVLSHLQEKAARRCHFQLAVKDPDHSVRAAAVLQIPALLPEYPTPLFLLRLLCRILERETDPFVLRVALTSAAESVAALTGSGRPSDAALAGRWIESLSVKLNRLHCAAENLSVRRWAAQARERLWCDADEKRRRLKTELTKRIRRAAPGKVTRIQRSVLKGWHDDDLGRVLALICLEDYPLEVRKSVFGGAQFVRGHRFGFRWWRFFHELRHPSPDKRQAFPHTIGRVFSGHLHIPSAILSELTPTKVPGEPLHMASESGWRPYLPLVDQMLSVLTRGGGRKPGFRIYTSEGITDIRPPKWCFRRWWARLRLTASFAAYAQQRNWEEGARTAPAAYVQALRRLGFSVHFRSHDAENGNADPAVLRFFDSDAQEKPKPFSARDLAPRALFQAGIFGFFDHPPASQAWNRFRDYFFSVYENSLFDLAIYAGLLGVVFFLRACYLKYRIRTARRRLPLVVGGWGTRGKSSVERLKGALINALGYGVLSKTTGCEAMFLHAHPYGKLREMFLFRPYDKATIWEQHRLTCMADRLDADALLWECMGLNPAYVRILQREWMKDDFSTITNTYPDHEDIQGPAGIDIPRVMTEFIPSAAKLATTEEQMLPILQGAADGLHTRVRRAGWLQAGMIPSDVLDRFSYEEHPYNVALAATLAEELGIERDFALKAMADCVIPDIGVLKAYPPAPLKTRMLAFVSGNSANERFGTLSNWRRTGFHHHGLEIDPHIWITTVVNNRADRIPRSKVFAGILAEDISADRHILIGSNLSGLSGYIRDAWRTRLSEMTLWPASGEGDPARILRDHAAWMRIPLNEDQVKARFQAMLAGQTTLTSSDAEALAALRKDSDALRTQLSKAGLEEIAADLIRFLEQDAAACRECQMLLDKIQDAPASRGRREKLDAMFHELIDKWFNQKIVVIWDYHADGNQIIQRICRETPPGLRNRIMGLQNIKGTGLDFVYSFQRWDRCRSACDQLLSDDPADVEQGLRTLSGFQEYNILCEETVRGTINQVKDLPVAQNERFQAELTMIRSNLDTAMKRIAPSGGGSRRRSPWRWALKIIDFIEAIQDAGDGVRRRKIADRIYRDLVDERIGHERAAIELQALNQRQKGGWLQARLRELVRRNHRTT